jgi:hypothetical protein
VTVEPPAAIPAAGAGGTDEGPGSDGLADQGVRGERGAAVVELLVVFLTLLVPLVYAMVVMADVQRALLATSKAAGCAGGFGPGAEVLVEVTYRVPVARLPFLGAVGGPAVTIGATHHTRVDRYRGLGG